MTLKVKEVVERADVIVYDYLCNPEILDVGAARAWRSSTRARRPAQHTLKQEEIDALLVEKTRAGKRVVRLKGGDPFVFGRGGEEAEALAAAGLRFEIIPGRHFGDRRAGLRGHPGDASRSHGAAHHFHRPRRSDEDRRARSTSRSSRRRRARR